MARTPPPPGPPPPHYRPPGTPLGAPAPPRVPAPAADPPTGVGPGAVLATAIATLLLGMVVGFFLGRLDGDDASQTVAAPLTTTTATSPSTVDRPGDTVPPSPTTTSPPGSELDPATIGSFDDPIPVGQAYILGIFEITVLDADLDAEAALDAHDPGNPAPDPDEQRVLVRLQVRLTDDTTASLAGIPFVVGDGTATWSAFEAGCGSVPEDLLLSRPFAGGEQVTGNLCFTVPADAVDGLALATEGFAGPVWFALPG